MRFTRALERISIALERKHHVFIYLLMISFFLLTLLLAETLDGARLLSSIGATILRSLLFISCVGNFLLFSSPS